jgi:Calx-beta domain-containing protein
MNATFPSLVLRALLVGLILVVGLVVPRTDPAQGAEKMFVFTGWVDCGRRSEVRCPLGDTLTIWTDDFGMRQKVTIDISWIVATLQPFDQDDFICIEVLSIDGTYQATALVTCKNDDTRKKSTERDSSATATPVPAQAPTRTPSTQRVTINIALVAPVTGGPLVASVDRWSMDGGLAFVAVPPTFEGNDMTFEVTLSSPINEQVKVDFKTEDISATGVTPACDSQTGNADYVKQSGTVTFEANQIAHTLLVPTCIDDVQEGEETLRMVLGNPSANAVIGVGSAVGTITDSFCECVDIRGVQAEWRPEPD